MNIFNIHRPTAADIEAETAAETEMETMTGQATVVEPIEAEAVAEPVEARPDLTETALAGIAEQLKQLRDDIASSNDKDKTIQTLHGELDKLRKNFYQEVTTPVMRTLLQFHDMLWTRCKELDTVACEHPDNQLLKDALGNLRFDLTAMEDTLEDSYDLLFVEPKVGDTYDTNLQQAFGTVNTDNKDDNMKIKSVRCGGFLFMARNTVFRKAEVIVYKHKE